MQNDEVGLYLAFPDGVFHYRCADCNAFCCRGHGFGGSFEREMKPLFVRYPALESLATLRQGDYVQFSTPTSGCVVLGSDNRCRIEKDLGKQSKPAICRLFPFNAFRRIGRAVAVSPHFLCPLRLQLPAKPGEVEGTHRTVEAAVRESGILDKDYLDYHVPRLLLHRSYDAEAALEREASFRDACSLALGRRSFLDTLMAESKDASALAKFLERAVRIMGLTVHSEPRAQDEMDDVLLALAAPVRLNLLSLSAEGIIRALALGGLLLRNVLSISADPMSLKGAYSVLDHHSPALRLLAYCDEPLDLTSSFKVKSPRFGDADLSFAAFVAAREIAAGVGPLTSLERAIPDSMTTSGRSVLLNIIGEQIDGSLRKPKGAAKRRIDGEIINAEERGATATARS